MGANSEVCVLRWKLHSMLGAVDNVNHKTCLQKAVFDSIGFSLNALGMNLENFFRACQIVGIHLKSQVQLNEKKSALWSTCLP